MRRAAFVLLLALVLALPGARAAGYDFTSGRSFAQPAGEGGVNVFTIPFHVNAPGFVYAKLLDTDRNAVNNGAAPNGSASAKTGWWVEWALVQGQATLELGARQDDKPTELVPVAAGEDDALVLRVHWPEAANTPGAADLVYGALAFRVESAASGPGQTSGASMDEARSFHVQIDFPGSGAAAPVPSPSATPDATAGGATPPATPTPTAGEEAAVSPTPDVSGVDAGASHGGVSSGNGTSVTIVNQEAPLPGWVLPVLVGQGLLVLAACVVAIVVARRPQRVEIVLRQDAEGRVVVEPPLPEPARSIAVREK